MWPCSSAITSTDRMGLWFFMSKSTRLVSTSKWATISPLAKRHSNGFSLLRRADSGLRLNDGWAKAQPAVVLILKRFRKRGHGFKSHPINWEKPGIKPGPLGLQEICYRRCNSLDCGRVPWLYNQYWPGGFMFFCDFMYRRRNPCLWPCSLALPVLAGWVYGFVVGAP